ncbi:MAG: type II toxin-antitoxin system VapC family toxin [Microthrixaceae bacterium]
MIVLDASALIEVLLWTPAGQRVAAVLSESSSTPCAPHLISVEVTQVLRRLCHLDQLDPHRAAGAIEDLTDFNIERYDHEILAGRIWQLRGHMTAYDAAYVALAELLDAQVVTFDKRLARAGGTTATFLVP